IQDKLPIDIHWVNGIIALIGAVIFQVGGNLLNDYFDFKYKVDRKDTYSSRILVDEQFTPKSIYIFGITSTIVGCLIGVYLLWIAGWHLLWIGALGVLGSYFYNRLKYIALGDLNIFIIYGLLIGLGVTYEMTGQLLWQSLAATTPSGLLIVGILHANNTRDILNDKKAEIKTQAMLLGVKASKVYFSILMYGAYVGVLCLVLAMILHPLALVTFLTLPLTIKQIKLMNTVSLENLDSIKNLAESVAKLVMLFSLLLVLANFISQLFF
ncbi:MAG: prenyltransferase, partial [Prevotellaceae bacterium]|nr:prenyltransferase [Prevotellaceae bacterium]